MLTYLLQQMISDIGAVLIDSIDEAKTATRKFYAIPSFIATISNISN